MVPCCVILLFMHQLLQLILAHGYLIVFVGTLLEGETVVALAGFVAFQGHLELKTLFVVAVIGAALGDHFFFYLGRLKGREYLAKRPIWNERAAKIQHYVELHQNLVILGSRFMYGFRAITPIVLGTSKVSSLRFSVLNVLGAVIWAVFFLAGGFIFGEAIERFLGHVKRFEGFFVLGLITLAAFIHIFNTWRKGKEEKILNDPDFPQLIDTSSSKTPDILK